MLNFEVIWDKTPLRFVYTIEKYAYDDTGLHDASSTASDIL